MPGLDRTGPTGMGRGTGRGFGPCGMGMARGLGWRPCWSWPQDPTDRKEALAKYHQALEKELEDIKRAEKELK